MKVIRRDFFNVSRSDEFRIVPIGDVHIGAGACDEDRLKRVVKRVESEPNTYWLGMGDFADFVLRSDAKRFDPTTLADWVETRHLADLARYQVDRFVEFVTPIAGKCLGLVQGNHEQNITKYYERDVYLEIVNKIKDLGKQEKLALGYEGFLVLTFFRSAEGKRSGASAITIYAHHGSGGGKKEGSKANNLQETLWTIDCDIVLFGHTHNTQTQVQQVLGVVGNRVVDRVRYGAFCGSYLKSYSEVDTYSRVKGFRAIPVSGVEIILRPGAELPADRIKLITQT